MHVSAKDKSTGKANSVTIKSSGGLTDADIERMVQEAEAQRENDKKKKEGIEIKNEADTLIYNTEKQLQEHGAKIPQSVKDQVNGDIGHLKEVLNGTEVDPIKEALEKLKTTSMEIGKAIYSQANNNSESQSNEGEQKPEEEQQAEGENKEEKK
jgi:molecular chaperone DnaK